MSVAFLANGYSTFAQILFCKPKAYVYLVFMTFARLFFMFTEFQQGRDGAFNVSEPLCVTIYAYNPVIHAPPATPRLLVTYVLTYSMEQSPS